MKTSALASPSTGSPPSRWLAERHRWPWRCAGVAAFGWLLLGATGCVESAAYERAELERAQARRAVWERDQQLRHLQWQLTYLGQQVQERAQRDEAAQKETAQKLEELRAQNSALTERLTRTESQRLEPVAEPAGGKKEPSKGDRAQSAQNAQILDALARIEKLVRERDGRPNRPPDAARKVDDVLDPWNYGDRR